MPIVDPKAATAQAATASDSREKRRATRAKTKPGGEPEVTVLSEAKMLNLPGTVKVGGLSLVLVAPVIDKAAKIHEAIYTTWPDVIVFAAAGDLAGTGINPEIVADIWGEQRKRLHEAQMESGEVPKDAPAPPAVTAAEVRGKMAETGLRIRAYLPDLAESLWPLADTTPGIHWPPPDVPDGEERPAAPTGGKWLDDAIAQSLNVPQLADLLRAAFSCCGGFPGSVGERFP